MSDPNTWKSRCRKPCFWQGDKFSWKPKTADWPRHQSQNSTWANPLANVMSHAYATPFLLKQTFMPITIVANWNEKRWLSKSNRYSCNSRSPFMQMRNIAQTYHFFTEFCKCLLALKSKVYENYPPTYEKRHAKPWFDHPGTCTYVRLLGTCFKTGRVKLCCLQSNVTNHVSSTIK